MKTPMWLEHIRRLSVGLVDSLTAVTIELELFNARMAAV